MIAHLVWHIRALAWRLVGAWERRGMRRQPPPPPPPPPPPRVVIVVAVRPHPDPHTTTLRRHFAIGAVPDGRAGPLSYQQYARIARAVRAEHQEGTPP